MRHQSVWRIAPGIPLAAVCLCMLVTSVTGTVRGSKAMIAVRGHAVAAIVIPDDANGVEAYAASELQGHIEKISGAHLDIMGESASAGMPAVLIGRTRRGEAIVTDKELNPLGGEGFILRARGADVALRGLTPRANLYAVYALLEDHLGVEWLAVDTTIIPKRDTIDMTGLEDKQKPAFEYRESFFDEAFDGDWAARNRLNGQSYRFAERHGGKITYTGGFVHTLASLLPAGTYFKDHPEYFAENGGKRYPDSQLCLTNPDVLKIVTGRVLEIASSTAGVPAIISVSQNDNIRPCMCPRCRAVDAEEGSPAGTLLRFVNAVADAVAEKYPNVSIDTLAYQYTENAPRVTKPRPNVIIRLCHMAPSCDLHTLAGCWWNAKYVKNLTAWSRISNRLYVWHYVTDFAHYLMPFPDLDAIVRDIPFYHKHNVRGFFAQGSYQSPGGDMADLKSWVIAKMLWNPAADPEKLISEFEKGYYGAAAPAMTEYLNIQRRSFKNKRIHFHLYSPPQAGHLKPGNLAEMQAALDRAGRLAASDPLAAEHVRKARLAIEYTQLDAPELFVEGGKLKPADRKKLFDKLEAFKVELKHFNVTNLQEGQGVDKSIDDLRLRIFGWNK